MRNRATAFTLVVIAGLALSTAALAQDDGVECSHDAYNCSDFSTCAEAHRVFDACSSDVHGLDRDKDGIPCESLCDE